MCFLSLFRGEFSLFLFFVFFCVPPFSPQKPEKQHCFYLFSCRLFSTILLFLQEKRETNNIFNLAYEILSWKVHRALIKAKLEPYLGFLHSVQYGKPSLVCDFMELYRCLIDDFLIEYCRNLRPKDFIVKFENLTGKKKGRREYLSNKLTRDLMEKINTFFETTVVIPRINVGKKQSVETLIKEEALLLAKSLRNEGDRWKPRIVKDWF